MIERILAKGSSGGRSSSSSRSSSSKSSGSSSRSSTPSKPKAGTSTAKPGSSVKTKDGKTVKSSTAKPSNKKFTESRGVVGDNGYTPRFQGGYTPPAGSVVYYPQHNFSDYLLLAYLMNDNSPAKDSATIVQPDGKQVESRPADDGFDGLAVFNWILLVVIILAVIGGIVWGVNKLTNK